MCTIIEVSNENPNKVVSQTFPLGRSRIQLNDPKRCSFVHNSFFHFPPKKKPFHTLLKALSPTGSKASSPFPGSTEADIIELQDLRLSPLPSIRSRSGLASTAGTPGGPSSGTSREIHHDPAKFPPSFRISRAPMYGGKNSGLRYRGPRQQKPKVMNFFVEILISWIFEYKILHLNEWFITFI